MEIIYIDRLFILNLIIDYLLALGSARVCGLLLRRWRYFFSSLFGAVYAVLSLLPGWEFLTSVPLKLCSGIIMSLIAYGGERKFMRCTVVFFAVSAFFGGIIWALSLRGGVVGNYVYIPLSMPILLFSFGICYVLLRFVFSRTAKGMEKQVYITNIIYGDRCVTLRTLADSGNTLYDPVSGARVLVASFDSLRPLFPDLPLEIDSAELAVAGKGIFRLIPYSAVGTDGGLLAAFKPTGISLDGKNYDDILLAVSPHRIEGDGFDSVIGI